MTLGGRPHPQTQCEDDIPWPYQASKTWAIFFPVEFYDFCPEQNFLGWSGGRFPKTPWTGGGPVIMVGRLPEAFWTLLEACGSLWKSSGSLWKSSGSLWEPSESLFGSLRKACGSLRKASASLWKPSESLCFPFPVVLLVHFQAPPATRLLKLDRPLVISKLIKYGQI